MGKVEDISVSGGLTIFNSTPGNKYFDWENGGEHYV
jgi:hypothetical protein